MLIVTDAWAPQVNGVVRTIETTVKHLHARGFQVEIIHPCLFKTFRLPTYKEIHIPYAFKSQLHTLMARSQADYIHIGVEGRLGVAARKWCIENKLRFTTAYHTKFPEYVEQQFHVPATFVYPFFRRFHSASSAVMSVSESIDRLLLDRGVTTSPVRWTRGVDTEVFNPTGRITSVEPYALYVGRVSVEKNIEAFLTADTNELRKVVVGSGPALSELRRKYPQATFAGPKHGTELAEYYASAEVFVFPSRTDTFGLVSIESLACGTPVAAYPVDGPNDIVTADVGCLSENLSEAIAIARTKSRDVCAEYVKQHYTWELATDQFISNLVLVR